MEKKVSYEIYYNGYVGDFCYIVVKVETDETGGEARSEACREDSLEKALRFVHYWQTPQNYNSFGVRVY